MVIWRFGLAFSHPRASAAPSLALYVAGRPGLLAAPGIAIVGTRRPTAMGARDAYDYAQRLAAMGVPIVSGLATGIDAAAHQGALAAGATGAGTIAVLGTGLARCYPPQHTGLAERIAAHGALVSEFALDTGPRRGHFPRRNRIVAGLVRGVLVVEASAQSGSLITARLAADAGRDVFAMPGSIHSPVAQGCNALIRDGPKLGGSLADIADEYPDMLSRDAPTNDTARESDVDDPLASPEGRAVFDALGFTPLDMDTVITHTGLAVADVACQLTLLELEGYVVKSGLGLYVRSAPNGQGRSP